MILQQEVGISPEEPAFRLAFSEVPGDVPILVDKRRWPAHADDKSCLEIKSYFFDLFIGYFRGEQASAILHRRRDFDATYRA